MANFLKHTLSCALRGRSTSCTSGSFSIIFFTLASVSVFAFVSRCFLSSVSRQPGSGNSADALFPTVPNFGFALANASITIASRNLCSSSALSPPLAFSPSTTRLSWADTLNVSSTWSEGGGGAGGGGDGDGGGGEGGGDGGGGEGDGGGGEGEMGGGREGEGGGGDGWGDGQPPKRHVRQLIILLVSVLSKPQWWAGGW